MKVNNEIEYIYSEEMNKLKEALKVKQRYICTRFHYLLSLDNDVLETSKRRAMFYNILSQNFIVKCLFHWP